MSLISHQKRCLEDCDKNYACDGTTVNSIPTDQTALETRSGNVDKPLAGRDHDSRASLIGQPPNISRPIDRDHNSEPSVQSEPVGVGSFRSRPTNQAGATLAAPTESQADSDAPNALETTKLNGTLHVAQGSSSAPAAGQKPEQVPAVRAPLTLYDKLKQRRAREMEMKKQSAKSPETKLSEKLQKTKPKSYDPETKPGQSIATKKASLFETLTAGTRIAVHWDGDKAFFPGTIRKVRPERKRPFFVVYDDGDQEWVNLAKETFRVLTRSHKPTSFDILSRSADKSADLETVISKKRPRGGKVKLIGKDDLSSEGDAQSDRFTHAAKSKSKRNPDTSLSSRATQKNETYDVRHPKETSKSRLGWVEESVKRSESDSDTDEEELRSWAARMFGIRTLPPPATYPGKSTLPRVPPCGIEDSHRFSTGARSLNRLTEDPCVATNLINTNTTNLAAQEAEDAERRRREANRPLTRAEIQEILRIEDSSATDCSHYVRRSMRQPSRAALSTHGVTSLIDKLRSNDTDMVVLKMKKYINDPDTPSIVIDAVLDALEENTNCEALYIQNFNLGMRDEQVMRLVKILQRPSCKIWCLNIGENYKVKMKTWEKFTDALKDTKVTHMYTSEHTITHAIKERMRTAMRENRKKHDMHNNPDNLETIIKCTHCWWNPINSKRLQPYLKKKGYDHILMDVEAQGLKGTKSGSYLDF